MTTYRLTGVKSHVAAAANYFGTKYGIKTVGGWRPVGSVPNSDHPKGLALDFMTSSRAVGDPLAADLIANYRQWGITYVIWWRRIWTPDKGWHDYHGPVPHTDHVHASFSAKPGTNDGTPSDSAAIQPVGFTDDVKAFAQLIPTLKKAIETLTNAGTYRDLGFVMVGAGLLLLGLILMVVGSAGTVTRVAAKTAIKAVK